MVPCSLNCGSRLVGFHALPKCKRTHDPQPYKLGVASNSRWHALFTGEERCKMVCKLNTYFVFWGWQVFNLGLFAGRLITFFGADKCSF